MLPPHYLTIYSDAITKPDITRDVFISNWGSSSVWGEDADLERTYAISAKIYDLAHMTVAGLAKSVGMSNRKLAMSYGIPRGTMDDWSTGQRTPPDYVKLLLAESVGYFREEPC